jgi:tetratricopeptide (TPR) repeat protein
VLRSFATAVTAACLVLSYGCRSAEHYLNRGAEFYRARRYQEASLNYRKAIQKDPNLGQAYLGLGRSEFKQQNFNEAWQFLNRAVELLPTDQTAKVDLGEFCLDGLIQDRSRPKNLYERLRAISDQLLAEDPKSFAGLRFKGYLALIDGRMDQAVRYFRQAVQIAPTRPDVVISLIEALFQNQQDEEAERIARGLIEARKSHGAAYDALYVHYVNRGRIADAEQILKLKVANNPAEPAYIKQLCEFYWRNGKQAQALDLIAKLAAKPESVAAYLAAGDFYSSIGRWEDAAAVFQQGMRAAPGQRVLFQKRIANGLIAQGKKDQAGLLVDEILKQQPEDEEALRIRAEFYLNRGDRGAIQSASEIYQRLLKKNQGDSKLHYGLAVAYQIQRRLGVAKFEYEQALRFNPNLVAARLGLAEIALSQRQTDDAVRTADAIIAVDGDNIKARLLRALALQASGRNDDAREELQRVLKRSPQEKSAYLQLGLIAIAQKDLKKAEVLFDKLQSLGGDNSSAATGLAVLYSEKGRLDQAYELCRKELARSSDRKLLHEVMAAIAMQAHEYDRAISEYNALLINDPNATSVYLSLADAFRQKGDRNNYVTALERAQRSAPSELMPTVLLASALENAGNQPEAIRQYRRALELQPDDPRVLNNLAYLLIQSDANVDEALKFAERAVQKAPDQPNFADTYGWICLKKNLTESALQIFGGLVKKHPDDPTYRYHFGAALLQKGDKPNARKELLTALSNKPSHADTDQIRALLARME